MRMKTFAIILALSFPVAHSAYAAKWHSVASHEGESIEIDKARIARVGDGKTMAWSRLVLNRELKLDVDNARYTIVEALNRYDCENRRFTTVKRVYLQGFHTIKEEKVSSPREMSVAAGSVDEKLLGEACKLRTVGEMKLVAEIASKAVAGTSLESNAEAPAKAMHADMRKLADSGSDSQPARIRPVSDAPAKADAPTKIELPSKAELAARAAADKAALIPATPAAAVPAAPTAAAPTAPAGAAAHAATPAAPPLASRHAAPYTREISRGAVRRKAATLEATPQVRESAHIHWSYEGEGAPANWSKLRPDFATCATGKRQSPIDIREGIHVDLDPIKFDYKPSMFRIIDNGHTVQVNVGEGSGIDIQGRHFELVQMHFHRPSEERVNGKSYDMVAHLVHKDSDGLLAVVAILLEKGAEHPLIQTLWNNLPLEVGQELTPSVPIDLNRLLPETRAYWTYMGSLTTPPCSEGVLWMVIKQPQQVSPEQVAIFSRLYRNNARPVQPANNRLIKDTR